MATLTVGYGKTYSTISAAITAADTGDTVEIHPVSEGATVYGLSLYQENLNNDKSLTFQGVGGVGVLVIGDSTWNSFVGVNTFNDLTFLLYHRLRNTSTTAGVCAYFNRCRMIQFAGYPVFYAIRSQFTLEYRNCALYATHKIYERTAETIRFYNCTMYASNAFGTAGNALVGAIEIYNCKVFGTALSVNVAVTGDYNEGDSSIPGANSAIRTPDEAGLNFRDYGPFELRVDASKELAGTTDANGVDLTELYTTDIDGRTRTQYSIGCSEGYRLYEDPDLPDRENVLTDDTVGGEAGLYVPCPEDGPNGVGYGAHGTEFVLSISTGDPPAVPTLTMTDQEDSTGATATISGSDDGTTNTVYTAPFGSTSWTEQGSVTGDGSVDCVLGDGIYWAYATSTNLGGCAETAPVAFTVSDGETHYPPSKAVADELARVSDGILGTDLFVGILPDEPDVCIAIRDTGEPVIDRALESPYGNIESANVQIVVRHTTYLGAYNKMSAINETMDAAESISTPDGVTFARVNRQQEGLYLGRDDKADRHLFSCNYVLTRET